MYLASCPAPTFGPSGPGHSIVPEYVHWTLLFISSPKSPPETGQNVWIISSSSLLLQLQPRNSRSFPTTHSPNSPTQNQTTTHKMQFSTTLAVLLTAFIGSALAGLAPALGGSQNLEERQQVRTVYHIFDISLSNPPSPPPTPASLSVVSHARCCRWYRGRAKSKYVWGVNTNLYMALPSPPKSVRITPNPARPSRAAASAPCTAPADSAFSKVLDLPFLLLLLLLLVLLPSPRVVYCFSPASPTFPWCPPPPLFPVQNKNQIC